MSLGRHIILKRKRAATLGDPFRNYSFRTEEAPAEVTMAVEVGELEKADLRALEREADVDCIAPVMPVKLIAPLLAGDERLSQSSLESVESARAEGSTWGVRAVGASASGYNGAGVTVAVLDTGIDAGHPAFEGMDIFQKDFTGEGNGDSNGHGTHVAGTIFGRDVDGVRIGIAKGVTRALIGKVLGGGGGSSEDIVNAILWAVQEHAQVINMSLGIDFPGAVLKMQQKGMPPDLATSKALEAYRQNIRLFDTLAGFVRSQGHLPFHGAVLVVAAAGNESQRHRNPDHEITVAPPAAADGFASVAALQVTNGNARLSVAPFSNTGANVAAPGVGIISARAGGGLTVMNGTSMASPHVTGVAALWCEQLAKTTGRVLQDALIARVLGRATTTPFVEGFDTLDVGAGLVQAP